MHSHLHETKKKKKKKKGTGYDAYGYHQYHAQRASDDAQAAYHQYHAQQAAMHAQQQRSHSHLAPIYDNATYNAGYYNSPNQQSPSRPPPGQNTGSPSYDRPRPQPTTHQRSGHTSQSASGGSHQSASGRGSRGQSSKVQSPRSHAAESKTNHDDHDHDHEPEHERTVNTVAQSVYDRSLYSPYQISPDFNKSGKKDEQKDDSELPAPGKLKHAATVGDISHSQISYQQQSTDLRLQLEQIQNKKELKRVELENKRKKLIDKNSLTMIAQKELEETKKKWNLEREEIIKSYGGKIPSFIIESDKLRRDLENMSNRNSALQASLEVISSHLQNELYQLQYQLKIEKEIAGQTHEHNIELERRVRELRIEKLELETELKAEKDKQDNIRNVDNNLSSKKKEKRESQHVTFSNDIEDKFREYPPESTVIQNLLQAQVEFYFSDYNLKRDKRLLSDVVKPPRKGFLKLDEVMKLSRIRQLCSEIETLEEALRRSNILTLIREKKENNKVNDNDKQTEGKDQEEKKKDIGGDNDDEKEKEKDGDDKIVTSQQKDNDYIIWVGRLAFEKPREKEFPFRRTVFIFGIPVDSSEEFLHEMLKPFGSVSKIQFDHSPDGIDRKIGIRFLNKPRVYTLYYYDPNKHQTQMLNQQKINGLSGNGILDDDDELLINPNRQAMIFKTTYDISGGLPISDVNDDQKLKNIKCHKCGKDKSVSEGFYTTSEWKVIYCAQCAAQLAEDQLNVYYKERNIPQYQHNPRHKWLGLPPNDIQKRKTALVVFASQRQASKCAYVRTRIAYKGSFATHFHHYSKVKKEIVLSESDNNKQRRE